MSELMRRSLRWGSLVGVATSSEEKFAAQQELVDKLGVPCDLLHLPVASGLEEGESTHPRQAGALKIGHFAEAINDALAKLGPDERPDTVLALDVLPVALGKTPEEIVLKKPGEGEGTALEVTTQFFAQMLEAYERERKTLWGRGGGHEKKRDGKKKVEYVDDMRYALFRDGMIPITYYLLNIFTPVDKQGRIKPARSEYGREVVYDKLNLALALNLVRFLADPDQLRAFALKNPGISDVLTNKSVRGFRMAELMPVAVARAAERHGDKMYVEIEYPRGDYWRHTIDDQCDVREQRVPTGIKGGRESETDLSLEKFLALFTHNASHWLTWTSFVGAESQLLKRVR